MNHTDEIVTKADLRIFLDEPSTTDEEKRIKEPYEEDNEAPVLHQEYLVAKWFYDREEGSTLTTRQAMIELGIGYFPSVIFQMEKKLKKDFARKTMHGKNRHGRNTAWTGYSIAKEE